MHVARVVRLAALGFGALGCGVSEPAAMQHREPPTAQSRAALRDAQTSARSDVVAVLAQVQGTDSWCTGIVIEPGLVLTAQHCLVQPLPPNTSIDCATATLAQISPASLAWVIEGESVNAVASSDYVPVTNVRIPEGSVHLCGQDIALLELANPLPQAAEATLTDAVPTAGSTFTASGYGTDGASSGMQRENASAKVQCVGVHCADARIVEDELLAQSGACEGDSGGPGYGAQGHVFAMALRSSSDCSQTAYLQLSSYLPWIASNAVEFASAQGQSTAPWAQAIVNSAADAGSTLAVAPEPRLSAGGGGCSLSRPKPRSWGAIVGLLLALRCARRRRLA